MTENILVEILNLCLELDSSAFDIYKRLADLEKKTELKDFWRRMSLEEKGHVHYWRELLSLALKEEIPQIFENPLEVKRDLEEAKAEINKLAEASAGLNPFLLAFNLEFSLLHPALPSLFQYSKVMPGCKSPQDNYEEHLQSFITALNEYGIATPELKLMGKTITKLWEDNRLLTVQNQTDVLTGLHNRRGLIDSMMLLAHLASRSKHNIAVMMLDIDNFKKVNDQYGHDKGDQVLKSVAEIIRKNIRVTDEVGRYGGEEFLVFLSPVEIDSLPSIAEKMRASVEKETKVGGLPATISIGVTKGKIKSDVRLALDTFIKEADIALYAAKNAGRNKVFFFNNL